MTQFSSLTNHFLIAMPTLQDPNFAQTVTYLCEHNEEGALGIVINKPQEILLGDILSHIGLETHDNDIAHRPIFAGGPVQPERGFVLHPGVKRDWESTLSITERISLTTSLDILTSISQGEGPSPALIALGYAGWGAGQLEQELAENSWLSGPADETVLFNTPTERRLEAAAALLGVDLTLISSQTGHA